MAFTPVQQDVAIIEGLKKTQVYEVLQYCKPKEQLVLTRKFGLVTNKETPLQRIGKDYNLTRERVRQIEAQALMRFRRLLVGNAKYLVVLDEAKMILNASGGVMAEDELITRVVDTKKFPFSYQEVKLILICDFDVTYLKRNKYLEKCFYLENLFEDLLTHLTLSVHTLLSDKKQSISLYECVDTMKTQYSRSYPEVKRLRNDTFYLNFFPLIRDVSTFDGRIGFLKDDSVNPKTIKLKILYTMRKLGSPIHYEQLPSSIEQYFPEKAIKLNTVHNELVKNNTVFVNLGLGTYGLAEWGHKGGTVVEILFRIMKESNRPMTVKEIGKELLKEKMASPNTIILNLQKYKTVFTRVEKGVYILNPIVAPKSEKAFKTYIDEQK